jgi:hypothetical protein
VLPASLLLVEVPEASGFVLRKHVVGCLPLVIDRKYVLVWVWPFENKVRIVGLAGQNLGCGCLGVLPMQPLWLAAAVAAAAAALPIRDECTQWHRPPSHLPLEVVDEVDYIRATKTKPLLVDGPAPFVVLGDQMVCDFLQHVELFRRERVQVADKVATLFLVHSK